MLAAVIVSLYVVALLAGAYLITRPVMRSREFEMAERREKALLRMKMWTEPTDDE